ncbi:MAG TPA: alpha/beta hydrolase [Streptosporangiaceae bacterium]|nr:alpha/beta hydrolase [Streptosporangiaceae bacterium]
MDRSRQVAEAPDGRTLTFAEWGDPDGVPVFALHGTPGCRLNRHPNEALIRSAGVRMVTYDRAGYGGSDRHRGRAVADDVGDVAAIADSLGIGAFSVFGGSGGGPHALAAAALLGDRVIRAGCVVGVAPYDVLGEEWFTGMDPENVKEFGWALEGEERLVSELERLDQQLRQQVAADPATMLGNYELSEADRKVLAREDLAETLREATLEQTRNGVWGWVDDDLAFMSPWGFDPAAITVPTQIRYGTSDVLVPAHHGEWLARTVPGAVVRVNTLGHLGDPDADLVERLGWLTGSST